jgi:hypothetical protein
MVGLLSLASDPRQILPRVTKHYSRLAKGTKAEFEETSEHVRPERTNKWPNSTTDMMMMMMMMMYNKSINQIVVQHNYLLNKFTSVEATCFGSYQRAIIKPYTISKPEYEEVL